MLSHIPSAQPLFATAVTTGQTAGTPFYARKAETVYLFGYKFLIDTSSVITRYPSVIIHKKPAVAAR